MSLRRELTSAGIACKVRSTKSIMVGTINDIVTFSDAMVFTTVGGSKAGRITCVAPAAVQANIELRAAR